MLKEVICKIVKAYYVSLDLSENEGRYLKNIVENKVEKENIESPHENLK